MTQGDSYAQAQTMLCQNAGLILQGQSHHLLAMSKTEGVRESESP